MTAKGVRIMEGATFLQEAVMLMGSQLDLTLTDTQQVIEDDVIVINLKPQYVVLLGLEVDKLLVPPGIGIVVTDGCHTQSG